MTHSWLAVLYLIHRALLLLTRARSMDMCIIYCDLAGFSRLPGHLYSAFLTELNDLYMMCLREAGCRIAAWDKGGDSLILVMRDPQAAARFAQLLLRKLDRFPWSRFGIPPTSMRVVLHYGPLQPMADRLLGRILWVGEAITTAERAQRKGTPGWALATQDFARILSETSDHSFTCEHLGFFDLPKNAGRLELLTLEVARPPAEKAWSKIASQVVDLLSWPGQGVDLLSWPGAQLARLSYLAARRARERRHRRLVERWLACDRRSRRAGGRVAEEVGVDGAFVACGLRFYLANNGQVHAVPVDRVPEAVEPSPREVKGPPPDWRRAA